MAQHFQTRYIDDLDGTDLGESANTLSFAFDGKDYSIDLSEENAEAFRQAIAPYIEAGRRVTGTRAKTPRARSGGGNTKAVREWARANGYDVSDRGRIPADIMDAYASAN
ncbi:histone-like nucleoid-structuring protein Lsr2 [Dietzia maris]|uniref:histone-like nucleoid-structuring protein Lsr2 n=1 Tax=Dietzia maris TaxID=37915 RepID=UPI00223A68F4|nr:Lsr2 family protein [Dietzia maris]MCT1435489.1 Lsr2 family protein [Dietzia maris]MCT1522710.1 Lsr2 family protein [Dietzia maris]